MEEPMTYEQALHAVQTGVKMLMAYDKGETSPKHLRVGVNSAMRDSTAMARLLIKKKVITEEEYQKAVMDEMVREVRRYEEKLSRILGRTIKLL